MSPLHATIHISQSINPCQMQKDFKKGCIHWQAYKEVTWSDREKKIGPDRSAKYS